MKTAFIFVLVTAGTVGASFGVARTDPSVDGWVSTFQVDVPLTLTSLFVLSLGIVVKWAASQEARRAVADKEGNLDVVRTAATAAAGDAQRLDADAVSLDINRLHQRLDAIACGPVTDFIENRQALIDTFGMGRYAEVMTAFAPGERHLNRAWSASTDGYKAEALTYLRHAAGMFAEAARLVESLKQEGA